jgi:hypothetical protein
MRRRRLCEPIDTGVTFMPLGKKTGRPPLPPMTKDEEQSIAAELFWSLVNRNGPFPPSETKIKTRCWEWIGGVNNGAMGDSGSTAKTIMRVGSPGPSNMGSPKDCWSPTGVAIGNASATLGRFPDQRT